MGKRYFILSTDKKKPDLGPSIFSDAASGLCIISKDPKNPVEFDGKETKKITQALRNGHIIELDGPKGKASKSKSKDEDEEDEDDETSKGTGSEGDKEVDLTKMTDAELLAHYKENWEVNKKDEDKFVKLTTEKKIEFLTE